MGERRQIWNPEQSAHSSSAVCEHPRHHLDVRRLAVSDRPPRQRLDDHPRSPVLESAAILRRPPPDHRSMDGRPRLIHVPRIKREQ